MPKSKDSGSKYNLRSKKSNSLKSDKDDDDFLEELEKLTHEEYKKLVAKICQSK